MYEIKEENIALMPRERLLINGAEYLSEQELLSILLRTGTKELSVGQLSHEVLETFETLDLLKKATIEELQTIKGIGKAKAIEIKAMIELGKRVQLSAPKKFGSVVSSEGLGNMLIHDLGDLLQEHLVALYLDTKNKIIRKKVIFIGTVNSSTANPREILHFAVKYMATSIIVAHNHPSGDSRPSKNDKEFTNKIMEACDIMGINFLDHIVVGKNGYYSFRENDLI
ncbi:RadC family protein [Floricoccus penangensis]|uniref:RadC family protein n=1 Tax=Floricoccus penangensis TaxID=1859475 RepID=UPI00203FB371|nr:DNA repair protein RadC [Floricoccus penangensis]URZ86729.1 DNA repair protein RadC [Floricoccus penangensis]